MKSSFDNFHAQFGSASLSCLFIGLGQVLFALLLQSGMSFLFILLAAMSLFMFRLYKGKTYQDVVNLRPVEQRVPWRRRSEQMLTCGILTFMTALISAQAPAPVSIVGLASCLCFALAGAFAMNDDSELSAKPPASPPPSKD